MNPADPTPGEAGDTDQRTPAEPIAPRSAAARPTAAPDEVAIGALTGVTVLLVEDDPTSREALALILAYYGARVLGTASVNEALECFKRSAPSIVLSDIGLPDRDGYSLLRAIRGGERQRGRHTPAIAFSGYPSRESSERARRAGFDAFLRKPIDIAALLKLVYVLAPHRA